MLRLDDYDYIDPVEVGERFDRALRVHPEEILFGMHLERLNAQLECRRCTIKGAPSGGLVLAVTTIHQRRNASTQIRFTKRLPAGRTDVSALYRAFSILLKPFTSGLLEAREALFDLVGKANDMGYDKQINRLASGFQTVRPIQYDKMQLEDCAFWTQQIQSLIDNKGKIISEVAQPKQ